MLSNLVIPVSGTATVIAGFHPQHIDCGHCRFCYGGSHVRRDVCECALEGFIISNVNEKDGRCPLKFVEENNNADL